MYGSGQAVGTMKVEGTMKKKFTISSAEAGLEILGGSVVQCVGLTGPFQLTTLGFGLPNFSPFLAPDFCVLSSVLLGARPHVSQNGALASR